MTYTHGGVLNYDRKSPEYGWQLLLPPFVYLYPFPWFLVFLTFSIFLSCLFYLWYQHDRPSSVVTIVPTEGKSRLYLRYFPYTYFPHPCRYLTYNRLGLQRIYQLLPLYQLRISYLQHALHHFSFWLPSCHSLDLLDYFWTSCIYLFTVYIRHCQQRDPYPGP